MFMNYENVQKLYLSYSYSKLDSGTVQTMSSTKTSTIISSTPRSLQQSLDLSKVHNFYNLIFFCKFGRINNITEKTPIKHSCSY